MRDYVYGQWDSVLVTIALFSLFVLPLLRPMRKREWRSAGVYEAFIIALMTEMYGFPLTIYILSSLLGVPLSLGHLEGHLVATLLTRLGILGLYKGWILVMIISNTLIFVGLVVIFSAWRKIHRSEGELVTDGIYARFRHPQYLGLILVTIGFLVQWPTLPTIVMWPILVAAYYRLAREEEKELERKFGDAYREYKRKVPMFLSVRI